MPKKPITWISLCSQSGYNYFLSQIEKLKDYSLEYYTSTGCGFQLYIRVEGMDREFAYNHFYTWLTAISIYDCYFIRNNPSSPVKELSKNEFLQELDLREEIIQKK